MIFQQGENQVMSEDKKFSFLDFHSNYLSYSYNCFVNNYGLYINNEHHILLTLNEEYFKKYLKLMLLSTERYGITAAIFNNTALPHHDMANCMP